MAAIDYSRPFTGGRPLGGRLSRFIGGLAAWNDARQTRKALSRLTDRELSDIGLIRGDIDRISG